MTATASFGSFVAWTLAGCLVIAGLALLTWLLMHAFFFVADALEDLFTFLRNRLADLGEGWDADDDYPTRPFPVYPASAHVVIGEQAAQDNQP